MEHRVARCPKSNMNYLEVLFVLFKERDKEKLFVILTEIRGRRESLSHILIVYGVTCYNNTTLVADNVVKPKYCTVRLISESL